MGHYPDHSPKPNIKSRKPKHIRKLQPSHIPGLGHNPVRRTRVSSPPSSTGPSSDQIEELLPCLATQPSTSPRHQTASSSCASPSPHIGRRISTAPRRRDTPPSMSRMKHRSAESGRAAEDQAPWKKDSEAEHIGGRAPTHRHQTNSDNASNRRQAIKASHPSQAHHERHPQEGDDARSAAVARSGKDLGFRPAYELGARKRGRRQPGRRLQEGYGALGRRRRRDQHCWPRISPEPTPTSSRQKGTTLTTKAAQSRTIGGSPG